MGKDVDDVKKGAKVAPGAVQREWVAANPRGYWTPEFWASCRPDFETNQTEGDA